MKIASHAFPSLAALLVLLTLVPASVAKFGDGSERNVAAEEHDDQVDRKFTNTTSDYDREDDDFVFTFLLTMEIVDSERHGRILLDPERFDHMLLKLCPIELEVSWLEKFNESVIVTCEYEAEDSSDRNLETVKRRNLRLRRLRRVRVQTRCDAGGGRGCSIARRGCPGQKGREGCRGRRALVEGEDLVTTLQQFGDEMSELFVSIENVNVTV